MNSSCTCLYQMDYLVFFFIVLQLLVASQSFTKVLVPSVYKEWEHGKPDWALASSQAKYNFTIFLYQKLHPSKPNYISTNRGTEAGVYLRYIVDHYDNFPDVAIFTHAVPEKHSHNWMEMVKCVRPNATYMSINEGWMCRNHTEWQKLNDIQSFHMKHCWRDVLKVTWDLYSNSSADRDTFEKLVPDNKPMSMCATCCQQFIMGKSLVKSRPLRVWKQLLQMIGVNDTCMISDVKYDPPASIRDEMLKFDLSTNNKIGNMFQGGTMEHLSHVVFGHQPLVMSKPTMSDVCSQFLDVSECVGSPCNMKLWGKAYDSTRPYWFAHNSGSEPKLEDPGKPVKDPNRAHIGHSELEKYRVNIDPRQRKKPKPK